LAYAAAVLDRAGYDIRLIDAPVLGIDVQQLIQMVRQDCPDLIVLDTSTPSIVNDLKVAQSLKEGFPHSFITLVGPHVTALPEETLQQAPEVDALARGEYELTLLDLADVLTYNTSHAEKRSLTSIEGLSFIEQGKIVHNPPRDYIHDLDTLPWVSRIYKKFLQPEHYFNPNAFYPMITLISSRGCPFRCSFCLYPQTMTGRKFRFRSIPDVVDEMEFALESFPQARAVFFEDDTLTANRLRCQEFAQEIMDRKLKVCWTANSRVDPDYETLRLMHASGCRMLCVGFESGDANVLAAMRKGTNKEKMFAFARSAKKAGILIHGCFIFGFPGEDRQSVEKTIRLAIDLKPDTAQFYPVMVYPGTEAYEEYKQKGWLTASSYADWLTPEGLHNCVVRNEYLTSKELVRLCDYARRRFYLRPRYFGYRLGKALQDPAEIIRTAKAAKTFVKYLVKGSQV
jgi:radical SAM superfamily enzyme YgiQ (UPF0313 family)